MNNIRSRRKILLYIIWALVLYIFNIQYKSILSVVVSFGTIFVFCAINPVCRKTQNTWIYVLTMIIGIPTNVRIVDKIRQSFYYDGEKFASIKNVLVVILSYLIIFSIEEVMMGIIGRMIWKRQQRIVEKEDEEIFQVDISKDVDYAIIGKSIVDKKKVESEE